jgi:hypothetical protein
VFYNIALAPNIDIISTKKNKQNTGIATVISENHFTFYNKDNFLRRNNLIAVTVQTKPIIK